MVGYERFKGAALPALNALYGLARDYVSFLQPVRLPDRRLLASGSLSSAQTQALAARSAALQPLWLKFALEDAQQALYRRAVQPTR